MKRYALPTPNACGLVPRVPVFHTTTRLLPPPTLLIIFRCSSYRFSLQSSIERILRLKILVKSDSTSEGHSHFKFHTPVLLCRPKILPSYTRSRNNFEPEKAGFLLLGLPGAGVASLLAHSTLFC